jgi:hypothetical protein
MTDSINIEPLVYTLPFHIIRKKWIGSKPTLATLREVSFAESNGHLRFFFSKWSNDFNIGSNGISELCARILNGDDVWVNETEPPLVEPYDSPMSLQVEELRYVVYVLAPGNWQFASRGYPLTMGTKGAGKDTYYDAHRVWGQNPADADQGTPFDDDNVTPRDGCKIAYMIADGLGSRSGEPNGKYVHRLNLHVDLLFGSKRMPIMIDPDIRYPGGSA